MQFKTNLIKGKLVKRYKRFLADVVLNDGKQVTVHCPNPGSMMNLTTEGAVVWLEPNDDPKKKLKYGWRLVESNNQAICVDTTVANLVIREALEKKEISQLNYQSFKPEVKYSDNSRKHGLAMIIIGLITFFMSQILWKNLNLVWVRKSVN